MMASASGSEISSGPSGVSNAPRGQIAAPSNPRWCDGPTSTATSYVPPAAALYA